jgi:hypothetical protein
MNLTNPGKPGLVGEGSTPFVSQLSCIQLNGTRFSDNTSWQKVAKASAV